MDLHAFRIPVPPLTSLSTRFLWVFPVHQAWALVSCIQPGQVTYYQPFNTLNKIYPYCPKNKQANKKKHPLLLTDYAKAFDYMGSQQTVEIP